MTGLPELHPHVDLTDADLITRLIADRRLIHQHPEEGWTEFETTWRIVKGLREIGLEPQIGEAVINRDAVMGRTPDLVADAMVRAENEFVPKEFLDATKGLTGAVAVLDTGCPGPTTAFRADIDCVLVRENQTPDHAPAACGFASKYPGLMHACGHDAHASLVLTAARWAVRHKDELCGKLKFIFQPAEEGVRGANAMAAAGVVDDVDILLGGHMGCQARLGELALQADGFWATTKFDVDIEGSPSHAGSDPHVGHNALMAACAAAMMLQGIPRHGRGTTRIAVGKLNAGEGRNVVPSHARMELEVRGSSAEVNQFMAAVCAPRERQEVSRGSQTAQRRKADGVDLHSAFFVSSSQLARTSACIAAERMSASPRQPRTKCAVMPERTCWISPVESSSASVRRVAARRPASSEVIASTHAS